MSNELERMMSWYAQQCDGDWEHSKGVHIDTLDNPGWSLDVNVVDTDMEGMTVLPTTVERSESDWLFYEVKDGAFRGRCGATNLVELVATFLSVAEAVER